MTACKMLILGLTGQCNFACTYCYAHEQPQQQMSLETAIQAVRLAAGSGRPFVLQFSGGEPLLAFDLIRDIASYVRDNRIPAIMQVQTNASLISPQIAGFLRQAQIGVGISLDGRPEANDRLRRLPAGGGTSRSILQGAQALAAAGLEIGITCVVADSNVRQLAGIVEMAYFLGNVRKLGFDLLRAQGRGTAVKPADAADLAVALRQVLLTANSLAAQTGKTLSFSHRERVQNLAAQSVSGFAHCHAMNGEALFVDASGELYACASLSDFPEFCLGHVRTGPDQKRLQAIGRQIRESMEFCPNCADFALCGGACFARWYGAGCANRPYLPECILKQTFIRDYEEQPSGFKPALGSCPCNKNV